MLRDFHGWPFAGGYVVRGERTGHVDWFDAHTYDRVRAASLDRRGDVSEALGKVFSGTPMMDAAALARRVLDQVDAPSVGGTRPTDLGDVTISGRALPSTLTRELALRTFHCALGPQPVSLEIGDDAHARWIDALFAPAFIDRNCDTRPVIRSRRHGDHWLVAVDDQPPDVFDTRVAAHWYLVRIAWELSHPERRWLALFHAAAVRTNTYNIVLAGTSGAGKTSLAASLLMHGAHQLADDLVAIDAVGEEIWPVPLSTSVKPGSWRSKAEAWRTLAEDALVPLGSTDTRFVRLKAAYRATEPSSLPTAVVFPVYEADAATTILRLKPLELLAGLGHTGTIFPDDDGLLEAFLHWADQTPAYVLNYGDDKLAVTALIATLGQLSGTSDHLASMHRET